MLFDIPADVRAGVWRHARYLSARDAVGKHLLVRRSPVRACCSRVLTLPVSSTKFIRWSRWDTNTGLDYVIAVYVDGQFVTGTYVDEEYTGRFWQRRAGSSGWRLAWQRRAGSSGWRLAGPLAP